MKVYWLQVYDWCIHVWQTNIIHIFHKMRNLLGFEHVLLKMYWPQVYNWCIHVWQTNLFHQTSAWIWACAGEDVLATGVQLMYTCMTNLFYKISAWICLSMCWWMCTEYRCMTDVHIYDKYVSPNLCLDLSMCWWRCTDYRCMMDVYLRMCDKYIWPNLCLNLSMCWWMCSDCTIIRWPYL